MKRGIAFIRHRIDAERVDNSIMRNLTVCAFKTHHLDPYSGSEESTFLLIVTMFGEPAMGSGEASIFFIASAANLVASDPMIKARPPPATYTYHGTSPNPFERRA